MRPPETKSPETREDRERKLRSYSPQTAADLLRAIPLEGLNLPDGYSVGIFPEAASQNAGEIIIVGPYGNVKKQTVVFARKEVIKAAVLSFRDQTERYLATGERFS